VSAKEAREKEEAEAAKADAAAQKPDADKVRQQSFAPHRLAKASWINDSSCIHPFAD
jgi:hypothetical protein